MPTTPYTMCLCVSIYARYSVVLSIETVNSFARRHQFDAKDSKPFRLRKTNSFETSLFVFNFVSRTVVRMNNVKCGQMKIGFPFVRWMWVCLCVCKLSFLFFFFLFANFFSHVPEMHEQRKVMIRMISIWMGDCIKKICLPHFPMSQQ